MADNQQNLPCQWCVASLPNECDACAYFRPFPCKFCIARLTTLERLEHHVKKEHRGAEEVAEPTDAVAEPTDAVAENL
ncbi:unnamed protein product [Linum trigynum]|uniref:C2H2-type domain-containing protein n=1 Tax=Linum trigynum TaxID=586398 RepID=A0AAV2CBZ1_9ROSI